MFYSLEIASQLVEKDKKREREKKLICSFVHLYCYYTIVERRQHSLVLACLMNGDLCFVLVYAEDEEEEEKREEFSLFLVGFIITTFSSLYARSSFFIEIVRQDSFKKTLLFFSLSLFLINVKWVDELRAMICIYI
jgi:hypothetical protein